MPGRRALPAPRPDCQEARHGGGCQAPPTPSRAAKTSLVQQPRPRRCLIRRRRPCYPPTAFTSPTERAGEPVFSCLDGARLNDERGYALPNRRSRAASGAYAPCPISRPQAVAKDDDLRAGHRSLFSRPKRQRRSYDLRGRKTGPRWSFPFWSRVDLTPARSLWSPILPRRTSRWRRRRERPRYRRLASASSLSASRRRSVKPVIPFAAKRSGFLETPSASFGQTGARAIYRAVRYSRTSRHLRAVPGR